MATAEEVLAARLIREEGQCELVSLVRYGVRCSEPAVAVRFAGPFVDVVCAEHAARSEGRGGTRIIHPPATVGAPRDTS